jgi:hypothetical protein
MHGDFPAIAVYKLYTVYCIAVYLYTSGASGVKIWHPPRTDRENGSQEGRRRGKEWEGRKPV